MPQQDLTTTASASSRLDYLVRGRRTRPTSASTSIRRTRRDRRLDRRGGPGAVRQPTGDLERPRRRAASPRTATTASGVSPARRRRGTRRAGFSYYDHMFPLRGKHSTGTASAPAAAIRARTSSPSAAPDRRRPRRQGPGQRLPPRRRQLRRDRRRKTRQRLRLHAPAPAAPRGRARSRPASVIGYEGDTGNAPAATCTSRCGRPRLVRGRQRARPDAAPEEVGQLELTGE